MTSVRSLASSKLLVFSLLLPVSPAMISSPLAVGQSMPQAVTQPSSASSAADSVAERCSSLVSINLGNAKVSSATLVAAAGGIAGVKISAHRAAELPAFCRVQVTDRPSADSEIFTEVWLPASGWNGKYRGQGNGGFAGEIAYLCCVRSYVA